jgi:hypothetical protein
MSAQPDENRRDELAAIRNGDEHFTDAEIDASGGDTMDFGDGRATIRVFSGRYVHPLDPRPDEIDIVDIAHALSNQCRFSGHVRDFLSVAQHSVYVAEQIIKHDEPRVALWGLLHDASEAYLVDLPKPLKMAPGFGEFYRRAEADLMVAICSKFNLPLEEPEIVRHFDKVLVCTEARDLMGRQGAPWYDVTMLPFTIQSWSPKDAEFMFLDAFKRLTE